MEYKPSFTDQLDVDYISHHGIKGMHWGVRRFEDENGHLTPAGRKRYYGSDGYLTKEGREARERQRTNFISYRDSTLYNTRAVNQEFSKAEKRYKELERKAKNQYSADREAWTSGTDFKGMSYDQFKDAAAKRYSKTSDGKERDKLLSDMRNMLDETAKEHPFYSKEFKQLRTFNPNVYAQYKNIPMSKAQTDYDTINYGKQVVNELINSIAHS